MEENKFRYFKLFLIDDDNNSKIFFSEKNKYYIRNYNKSIHVKILNEFKDITKSYGVNVIDTTDNYYKINEPSITKHCKILLIDDYNHSKNLFLKKICTILVVPVMMMMNLLMMMILLIVITLIMMIIIMMILLLIMMN